MYESDVIRKRLLGYSPQDTLPSHLYSNTVNERTFSFIRREAEKNLKRGKSVLVDATFIRQEYRKPFMELGFRTGVPTIAVHVFVPEEVVKERLTKPRETSDATYRVYLSMKEEAELPPNELFHLSVDGTAEPYTTALRVSAWIEGVLKVFNKVKC